MLFIVHIFFLFSYFFFFFFNDTATTEIYTLSLHDALPILPVVEVVAADGDGDAAPPVDLERQDRKSTRLNSSHSQISYAVFCLKKKKKIKDLNNLRPKKQKKDVNS